MHLDVQCMHCHKWYDIEVDKEDFNSWENGTYLIQDALPYLTKGERELLISNTCDSCWDKMFGFLEEGNPVA